MVGAGGGYDEDGHQRITIVLPAEQGALVTAALAQVQAELEQRWAGEEGGVSAETPAEEPAGDPERRRASLTEAVVEMSRLTLDRATPDRARRARARLSVQVDPVSGWARLADGERCRFPGCARQKKLHAHHVRFWSEGGATDLANLVLLCARHHTLVHRDGFVLTLDQDRRLTVLGADGSVVPHHWAQPWGDVAELDPERRVGVDTPVPDSVGPRMDLGYCVAVLLQQAA